jgi:hypothetical protein
MTVPRALHHKPQKRSEGVPREGSCNASNRSACPPMLGGGARGDDHVRDDWRSPEFHLHTEEDVHRSQATPKAEANLGHPDTPQPCQTGARRRHVRLGDRQQVERLRLGPAQDLRYRPPRSSPQQGHCGSAKNRPAGAVRDHRTGANVNPILVEDCRDTTGRLPFSQPGRCRGASLDAPIRSPCR